MNARFRVAANAAVGTAQGAPSGSTGSSAARGNSTFHPTVISLLVLVLAEYGAYIWLRYYFRHAHGG